MRPASEAERRRLGELFAELCAIPSPSGQEAAVGARVQELLRGWGYAPQSDAHGNVLARREAGRASSVLLCAHLDTVPHGDIPIEPVLVNEGWENRHDAILGADNKAAIAVMLLAAQRASIEGAPVDLELLFTTGEETALAGAKAFDIAVLRSRLGYVYDHATPIGEIVMAAPTYYRLEAELHGRAAHAGIRPEDGRSAIVAAARAIAAMRLGRLDPETTANIGWISGGPAGATNVVPERCRMLGEARSLDAAHAEAVVAEMVDHLHDAANEPSCECDLDVTVERLFEGYRHPPDSPAVAAAQRALGACGYTPRPIVSGGGSDANAFEVAGLHCVCLANGTERNHEPTERVSVAALDGMLDVTFALLDACAEG
ncbi:M20/M25/M40 family metallo-hydrolase [Baekduia soli]|uniref:M20/M25/M40 family metallo-hydrolase n=1 Tax=Baekduia soli TaxID=496014 RepID=A0A5B8U8K2_9ACTN|nr:M20/M25/M40 family metallo-hydrolase [Baekduia soli]QEC49251.1 M20/M25/M40 family metallo-hydrolase [Baekduia soli]